MGKNARTMNRRDKRRQLPQKGFTQPLQGNRLSVARATNVDVHVKASCWSAFLERTLVDTI